MTTRRAKGYLIPGSRHGHRYPELRPNYRSALVSSLRPVSSCYTVDWPLASATCERPFSKLAVEVAKAFAIVQPPLSNGNGRGNEGSSCLGGIFCRDGSPQRAKAQTRKRLQNRLFQADLALPRVFHLPSESCTNRCQIIKKLFTPQREKGHD